MTVAATIGMGTGATPSPGLGKSLGAGQAGAATQSSSGSIAPAGASFRTGWQSLLATLGASEGLNQSDAVADQENTFTGQPTEGTAGKASAATAALAAGAALLLKQKTEAGNQETSVSGMVSPTDARAAASAALSAAEVAKSDLAGTGKKDETVALETRSSHSARSALSAKVSKPEGAAAAPLPGLVPAAIASPLQAVPVTAASSRVAQGTDERVQSAQTSHSADLFLNSQPGFATASSRSHSLASEQRGNVGGSAQTAAQQAAAEVETRTRQGEALTASSLSGSSSPTLGEAESSLAGEGVPPLPGAMLAGNGNPPASSSSLTPSAAPDPNLAKIPASSQNSLLPLQHEKTNLPESLVTGQTLTDSTASGQNPSLPLTASQGLPQTQAQTPGEISTLRVNQGANVLPASAGSEGMNSIPVASVPTASQSVQLPSGAAILDQPGSTGGGKTTTSDKLRSARGIESVGSAQHESRLLQGQSSAPVVDASAMAHALSGAHGAVNAAGGGLAGDSASAPTGPDTRETFATLDAGGATGKPTWIHASAHQAEAGYQDPALGWVSVRADSSGGGVHAELVPGSADAAQALGGHMAGLSAYLAEHHTPVETLTLSSPQGGWTGAGSGQGSGQGMQQGAGQQSGQETAQGADTGSSFNLSPNPTILSTAVPALPAWSAGLERSTQGASAGGSHISVMA